MLKFQSKSLPVEVVERGRFQCMDEAKRFEIG